jgi:hypothetical protein
MGLINIWWRGPETFPSIVKVCFKLKTSNNQLNPTQTNLKNKFLQESESFENTNSTRTNQAQRMTLICQLSVAIPTSFLNQSAKYCTVNYAGRSQASIFPLTSFLEGKTHRQ